MRFRMCRTTGSSTAGSARGPHRSAARSEEHTSELQSPGKLVCRLLLEKKTDVFREKCLALLVELGELANETRCFKFRSKKPRNDDSVLLEEYVDNRHFRLSLGLE